MDNKQKFNDNGNNVSVSGWGYESSNSVPNDPHHQAAQLMSERIGQEAKTPIAMKILGILLLINSALITFYALSSLQTADFDVVYGIELFIGAIQFILGIYLLKGSRLALKIFTLVFFIDLSLSIGSIGSPIQIVTIAVLAALILVSWVSHK